MPAASHDIDDIESLSVLCGGRRGQGLAVVNWVDGFKNMGQLSWVYSPSFTTVSSITVITGTLPQPFVSGFTG